MRYMRESNAAITNGLLRQTPDVAYLFPDFGVVLTPSSTPSASSVRAIDLLAVAAQPTPQRPHHPSLAPLHFVPP